MGILIRHGSNTNTADMVGRGLEAGAQFRAQRVREAEMKAERIRREQEAQRLQAESTQRLAAGEQAMQQSAEDQSYQQGERKRLGQARQERVMVQNTQLEQQAGVEHRPVPTGSQGPEDIVPEGLPRELWPDYFNTRDRLNKLTDPEARAQEIGAAHQRWTAFSHTRAIDDVLRGMSSSIDTGALSGDPNGKPDERETEMYRQLRGSMDRLSEQRSQVAQNPESFDPSKIDAIRKEFDGLKTKLADVRHTKGKRERAVNDINEMAAQFAGNRKTFDEFDRIRTRVETDAISVEDGLQQAERLAHEPEMYGEGQPFNLAPPQTQKAIRKEARENAMSVLSGNDTWKEMTPTERSTAILQQIDAWVPEVAKQYGWGPAQATQGPMEDVANDPSKYSPAWAGGGKGAPGAAPQGPGAGGAGMGGAPPAGGAGPSPIQMVGSPEKFAQAPFETRVQAVRAAQQHIASRYTALEAEPPSPERDQAMNELKELGRRWLAIQGSDPTNQRGLPKSRLGPRTPGDTDLPKGQPILGRFR